jgi:DNA-binding GntR family transcriptional regulator
LSLGLATGGTDPVQTDSNKLRIYRSLREEILGGVFDMGQRLNESQLAFRYGVSKTPVREALTLLTHEGLVEVQPRVGYLTSRVTLKDVEDIFEMRLIVESAAAERAADRIAEAELARLASLRSTYRPGDRDSYRHFLAENLDFHRSLALATGNKQLVDVVVRLLEQMQRLLILRLEVGSGGQDMVDEHGEIIAALRARAAGRARELLSISIVNARRAVVDSLVRRLADRHI